MTSENFPHVSELRARAKKGFASRLRELKREYTIAYSIYEHAIIANVAAKTRETEEALNTARTEVSKLLVSVREVSV